MLEKIKNYFIGTDIISCCNELKKKYPDKTKQINQERNRYIFFGKIAPSIIDIGGIISLCIGETIAGAIAIGVGERMRNGTKPNLLEIKLDYSYKGLDKSMDKLYSTVIKTLEELEETK